MRLLSYVTSIFSFLDVLTLKLTIIIIIIIIISIISIIIIIIIIIILPTDRPEIVLPTASTTKD